MKKLFILMGLLLVMSSYSEAAIPMSIIRSTKTGVFEVLKKRPMDPPSIKYATPLSYASLPFDQRNDAYESIGSAFLIGDNVFASAAHVIDVSHDTLNKTFYIRDSKKRVYQINKVVRYSEHKDLIVFEVDRGKRRFKTPFKYNVRPSLNDDVYAVGNALGEGIVIRSGHYTSKTSEPLLGKWKWIRFSAAASPGNSGGPLLDSAGRVIGVVLQRSTGENLNVALPIEEVFNQSRRLAEVYRETYFEIAPIQFQTKPQQTFVHPLPAAPETLISFFAKKTDQLSAGYYAGLMASVKKVKHIPPYSEETDRLFNQSLRNVFPVILSKDGLTPAVFRQAGHIESIMFSDTSSFQTASFGKFNVFKYDKPDHINIWQYQQHMGVTDIADVVVKGHRFSRTIGSARLPVSSLGKPTDYYMYQDQYSRTWFIGIWDLVPMDSRVVIVYSITPEGVVGIYDTFSTKDSHYNHELRKITDLLFFSYRGTFSEWKTYLAGKTIKPKWFKEITMVGSKTQLNIEGPALSFSINSKKAPITEASRIQYNLRPDASQDGLSLFPYEVQLDSGSKSMNKASIKSRAPRLGYQSQRDSSTDTVTISFR
ncbi:trypsin-like peptidase domain-containing protein [bacterium]|jgi:serine protease Do|nr:trypsin-like peptidase domain-containing protein [bacterium]